MYAMTKQVPTDPDEIVRINLKRFREESKLSQADASDLSGVPVDAIRRYEGGITAVVPGTVLKQLADVYGHPVDHFWESHPPPAKVEERATYFLRTMPGAVVDADVDRELRQAIERANTKIRARKARK